MDFNAYISKIWNKEHSLALTFNEPEDSSEKKPPYDSINIHQRLDWIDYCNNHNITIEENYIDELFDNIISNFTFQAFDGNDILYGDIMDCIDYAPTHKKQAYDEKLIEALNSILTGKYKFETTFNLFFSWIRHRFLFLNELKLGFPLEEAGIMICFYNRNRNSFIFKRDTDFLTMKAIANYFLMAYESCKKIKSPMISEDLIKARYFLQHFMRDVLVSAINNGYYEYESKIKQIIEELKLEKAVKPTVFISYQWSKTSSEIADRIQNELKDIAAVRRDTTNLVTGDSLSEFMKTIRSQDFAILIITDEYLTRRNCMYEVAQLLRDYDNHETKFWERVLLFVTAKIYAAEEKAAIIKFWDDKVNELDAKIKDLHGETTEKLAKELKECRYISMEIGKLLEYASDTLCEKDLDKFILNAKEKITKLTS